MRWWRGRRRRPARLDAVGPATSFARGTGAWASMEAAVTRHLPQRPEWTCAADGKPWPCPGARVHLRSQYADDQLGLSMYMSAQLINAAADLGDLPPDLFNRFMAWCGPDATPPDTA